MTFNRDWEERAQNRLAWARTPDHDVDWHYRSEFVGPVPPAGRATLEIGYREGRVARDQDARDHRVTAVDGAPTLLAAAAAAHPSRRISSPMPRTCPSRTPLSTSWSAQLAHGRARHAGRGARGGARPAARHR
jgi:hypothetical protein